MTLGYARPLEASGLWKLQNRRSAGVITEAILLRRPSELEDAKCKS